MKRTPQKAATPEPADVEEMMIRAAAERPLRLGRLDDALLRFAGNLGPALAEMTGRDVASTSLGIRYPTWEEERSAVTGVLATAEVRPWTGEVLMSINRPVLLCLVGRILGGETEEDAGADRALTPLERRIARRLLDRAAGALGEAVSPLRKVSGQLLDLKTGANDEDFDMPGGHCVVAEVSLEAGPAVGKFKAILPMSLFGADIELLSRPVAQRTPPEAAGWRQEMSAMIASARVKVTAVIGEGEVRLGDALGWTPGMTLDLGLLAADPARIACGGRTIFLGLAGRRGNGSVAIQITEDVETREVRAP
jgi:flagellar motor switch protein FliM